VSICAWPVAVTREAHVTEAGDTTTESSNRRLRILMLSWEYPPVLVGGLGRHVHALATSLAAAGHEVTVGPRHAGGAPLAERREETNRTIHTVEYWLGHEAARLISCSGYMRWEVSHLLDLAPEKITVIPNGVDAPIWQAAPRAVAHARARYAGDGPMLGFAGRLVSQKRGQHVIHALHAPRRRYP